MEGTEVIGETLFENDQWLVARHGMQSKETLNHKGGYFIRADRLIPPPDYWIAHMCRKSWCDPRNFVEAFYKAAELSLGKTFERNVIAFVPNWPASQLLAIAKGEDYESSSVSELMSDFMEKFERGEGLMDENSFALLRLNEAHAGELAFTVKVS